MHAQHLVSCHFSDLILHSIGNLYFVPVASSVRRRHRSLEDLLTPKTSMQHLPQNNTALCLQTRRLGFFGVAEHEIDICGTRRLRFCVFIAPSSSLCIHGDGELAVLNVPEASRVVSTVKTFGFYVPELAVAQHSGTLTSGQS